MPATPRKDTTATTTTEPVTTELPPEAMSTAQPASTPPPAPEVAPPEEAGPPVPATEATGQDGSALVDLITFPVRASQGLVRDAAVTARHPEAVAYWTGLAALAVLGVLEWPVAAAAGLGVVVAGAVRRGHG